MQRRFFVLVALIGSLCSSVALFAQQNAEQQALDILKLFEAGQQDTAYILIEPLKKTARFVPAALYVRGQMTPDDRALGLYKEVIALEPGGEWADEAAMQLIRRYIAKRDSAASYTWMNMLRVNYPRSPFVKPLEDSLMTVKKWMIEMEEPEMTTQAKDTAQAAEPEPGTVVESEENLTTETSTFRGYALQVGVFPTEAMAKKQMDVLNRQNLKVSMFPKLVEGKTQYALVVGPYDTISDANKEKKEISATCKCKAFTVKVE